MKSQWFQCLKLSMALERSLVSVVKNVSNYLHVHLYMKSQWLKLSVTYERSVVKIVSDSRFPPPARILLKVTIDIHNPAFNLRLYVDNI